MVISVPLFSSVLLALVVAVPADFDVDCLDVTSTKTYVGLCSVRGDPNEHYDPHGDLYLRPFLQLDSVHQFESKFCHGCIDQYQTSINIEVELDLDALKSTSFFGVYDGHGGAEVAMYCAKRFHVMLREEESFLNNLPYAITSVCSRLDDELEAPNVWRASLYPHRSSESSSESSDCFQFLSTGSCANVCRSSEAVSYKLPSYEGSTACVVIIRGNQITVGNVGDSHCVLSKNGQAIDLSTDHKPNVPLEHQRILRVGGQVWREKFPAKDSGGEIREQWGPYCIEGKLSTSRALAGIFLTTISGDFAYKNIVYRPQYQMVTHFPDIRVAKITGDTEFLVIASDGICSIQILIVDLNTFFPFRDHMSSQDVVDFVHEKLNSRRQELCQNLINQGKKRECFTEDSQLATNKNIAPNTTTLWRSARAASPARREAVVRGAAVAEDEGVELADDDDGERGVGGGDGDGGSESFRTPARHPPAVAFAIGVGSHGIMVICWIGGGANEHPQPHGDLRFVSLSESKSCDGCICQQFSNVEAY
uniref:protein-serine/threonine phosphatase n=1 Tax=Oryza glumipatula TaxID=40148 RepID=A0A0D9YUQ2_9ORYZ